MMKYTTSNVLSLISHIHSQSQDFLQKELSSHGLSEFATSHGNILFCLSTNQDMTLGELSKKINRDKSTTTALIKKLEKENLIIVKKDSSDSRKKMINLTEEGKKLNQATSELSKKLMETCWKDFSENEKKQLVEMLNKLSENLCN